MATQRLTAAGLLGALKASFEDLEAKLIALRGSRVNGDYVRGATDVLSLLSGYELKHFEGDTDAHHDFIAEQMVRQAKPPKLTPKRRT